MKDILAPAEDWTDGCWAERIDQCASMLFYHGYITESAREKIGRRLELQIAIAMEAAKPSRRETGNRPKGTPGD